MAMPSTHAPSGAGSLYQGRILRARAPAGLGYLSLGPSSRSALRRPLALEDRGGGSLAATNEREGGDELDDGESEGSSRKDYLEISWAELRSMVEPSFAERSLIYHKDYLTTATAVTSSAVNITEHAVLTADGQSLAYDYLVVATGHVLASPGSKTDRLTEFQKGSLMKKISSNDRKDYLEISWAELRSMVEPSFAERSLIYHKDYLTTATAVTSSAVNITEHAVLTADGQSLAYDYLVVATGHVLASPGSKTGRLTEFQKENEKIKSSKSVLIIGGGPTGVELAGEIAVDYPEKKVTIVRRGSRLLEFIDQKASKKCLDWLTSKKVDVLFKQSVDLNSLTNTEQSYKTSSGETITADCHFLCIGKPLSSSWLHDTILKESLDNKGRLMVEKDLRVKGYNNVFAIGDITDIPEIKQGYLAQKHALLVAKNLKLLIKGSPVSKLGTYCPGFPLAIVSLGREEAVAQLPFVTLTGRIPGLLKSGDLFVGKTRKQMGLDA